MPGALAGVIHRDGTKDVDVHIVPWPQSTRLAAKSRSMAKLQAKESRAHDRRGVGSSGPKRRWDGSKQCCPFYH
jgi:hypothetical protein